jgi:sterol desaturase/sphingolipid hydroxylase (fatty acid hydroxylase superfamily)
MSVGLGITTPALLAGSVVIWGLLFATGLPTLACSLIASGAMVSGLLVLERIAARPGLAPRPAGTLHSDVAFTATTTLVALAMPYLVSIPLGRAAGVALGTASFWPAGLPRPASIVACVLVADFTSYCWHRLQHTTGASWLWRIHSVHHSSRHFDLWMGGRVHPFDALGFTTVGYALLAIVGAPVTAIEIAAFFASMVGAVHHTSADSDCRGFNRIIPFADHHIVHHSILRQDAGNYGNITTLFDQLFGTYRAPTPRKAAPLGSWSLAPDYPQGDFLFQLASPFGHRWARAVATPPARRPHDEDRVAAF